MQFEDCAPEHSRYNALHYHSVVTSQPFWFVILSLGITGSLVGAVVAAVASGMNDRYRRRFDLQKWRAEFYLRPKLEALRSLHAAMVRSHYEINLRAHARMPRNDQEYRDLAGVY
jgi:hypothetical protein